MATFGKATNGASASAYTVDTKTVSTATPASSGTVSSLTTRLYLSSAGSSAVKGILYSDNAGAPGSLLAVTDEFTVSATGETEYTANFTGANQVEITADTPYWIGVHMADPGGLNLNISRDNTYGYQKSNGDNFADGPAASFGAPGTGNGPIDVYVTYTEGVAPPTLRSRALMGVGI
jgi:hypothetical protein